MSRVLSRKAHTAEEKRRQLREAGVIERYGPNANVNRILSAENKKGLQQEANYAAERVTRKNNGSKHASKSANKPNNKPNNKSKNNGKKPVKKWAPVNTSKVMRRV